MLLFVYTLYYYYFLLAVCWITGSRNDVQPFTICINIWSNGKLLSLVCKAALIHISVELLYFEPISP